jgi:hypothetical protein
LASEGIPESQTGLFRNFINCHINVVRNQDHFWVYHLSEDTASLLTWSEKGVAVRKIPGLDKLVGPLPCDTYITALTSFEGITYAKDRVKTLFPVFARKISYLALTEAGKLVRISTDDHVDVFVTGLEVFEMLVEPQQRSVILVARWIKPALTEALAEGESENPTRPSVKAKAEKGNILEDICAFKIKIQDIQSESKLIELGSFGPLGNGDAVTDVTLEYGDLIRPYRIALKTERGITAIGKFGSLCF